jgi:pyruvate dehydrogenase E1 component alpha subunit/2-oxoisovalerate dehydrogenase E1 component alpha subunit
MGPHSTSDDPSRYRSTEEDLAWAAKDPIDRLRRHLGALGQASDTSDAELDGELSAELAAAIDAAEGLPSVSTDTLFDDVYAEMPWHLREQLGETKRAAPSRRRGQPS